MPTREDALPECKTLLAEYVSARLRYYEATLQLLEAFDAGKCEEDRRWLQTQKDRAEAACFKLRIKLRLYSMREESART